MSTPLMTRHLCARLFLCSLLFHAATATAQTDLQRHPIRDKGFSIAVPPSWTVDSKPRNNVFFHAFTDSGFDVLVIASAPPEYAAMDAATYIKSELAGQTFFNRMVTRLVRDAKLLDSGTRKLGGEPAAYYYATGKLPQGSDCAVIVYGTRRNGLNYWVVGKIESPDSAQTKVKALTDTMQSFTFDQAAAR